MAGPGPGVVAPTEVPPGPGIRPLAGDSPAVAGRLAAQARSAPSGQKPGAPLAERGGRVTVRIAAYHNLHSGGALRTLSEQVRRLSAGHDLALFTLTTAALADVGGVPVRVFPFRPGPELRRPFGRLNRAVRTADLVRLVRVNRRVAHTIDAEGFDVVLVHPCRFAQAPPLLRYLRTPSVYYCHEPLRRLYEPPVPRPYLRRSRVRRGLDRVDPAIRLYHTLLQRNDRTATRAATRVLVNSRFTQANVRRIYGVEAHVCRHGIDTDRFRPLGLARDGFVLSVGALTPYKGFDLLIEGLACLPAAVRPPLRLICNYAEPQEQTYLEGLAADRRVDLMVR
ncbi:MAG TPA: hypothetical protein EYH27_03425, partial [Anaerolineales bacterium]|nr:hypothetical protein [Anaerolineales bacterium]